MIYQTKATENKMITEAQTLNTTGFYLWRFKHDQYDEEHILYLAPDQSTDRFAEFTLTLPGDADLSKTGMWHYYIYDGDGASTDYTTMTLLENGMIKLI